MATALTSTAVKKAIPIIGGTSSTITKATLSRATTGTATTRAISTAKADKATETVLTEPTDTGAGSTAMTGGATETGTTTDTTPVPVGTEQKLPVWAIALIAAGVIGAAVAVYYFFIRKK